MTRGKILIIDHEPEIGRAVTLLLRSRGYEVSSITEGVQAEAVSLAQKADLVIVDATRSHRDSQSFYQQLQASSASGEIPMIILSGADTPEAFEEAAEEGSFSCIKTPYDPRELLEEVARYLGRQM